MTARAAMNLSGAVVFVTGAAQGIGFEAASRFVAAGSRVVLVDVDEEKLGKARAQLGNDSISVVADVRDAGALTAAADQVVQTWGRIDVVVANAGVTPPPATLRTIEPDVFQRVIDINLLGAVRTVRATTEHIISSRGHIQLIGSCAAFAPGMGGAAYMISKAGVEQLGRALRIELAAHGVTVGISYFGIVDTALARTTLDDDPMGQRIGELLPWPLNQRIDAGQAAASIVDAVGRRKASSTVPRVWMPYAWLRGVINVVLDQQLAANPAVASIIRQLER
ncbi:short-chain dehydrogenase/reductase [Mycolicibacterium sp. lyk4-40-TYG-92]|uniref:short-chain dehydrogenase/reductase n=1 Tax=Mycolicibacterium sp. lyk4-40-TYG-92 TaxID=3040295 RepID=UPI00254B951C|nr:short-chain dehydrogenase/reductase [Mycolicibacterium sp. lyk4-40-TYG-92]